MQILGLEGVPEVLPGDGLAGLLFGAAARSGVGIRSGDIVVVCQKVVSKANGRLVERTKLQPTRAVAAWASASERDPREVQAVLAETQRVVRADRGILISRTHHGFVCANAGVDRSNAPPGTFTLLPEDPDADARELAGELGRLAGTRPAVVITDTFGRPFRRGAVEVALGVFGMAALLDYRGIRDPSGRELRSTEVALADQVAAAAGLVMGKLRRAPAAIVRGLEPELPGQAGTGASLVRPEAEDLFR